MRADDPVAGPRGTQWQAVQKALDEGKPKSALEALLGVEQAAIAAGAWAEVARAIATRVLAETGDRPDDDPERVIRLAAEIEKAPAETRSVLQAIEANWTWGYYQQNQWRYQQRTQGGADAADLASLAEWDLPTIVAHIRKRFATAVAAAGSPERKALQALPVAEWDAVIAKGSMPDAYRPTVWDVIARDALAFAASGERGLVAPEDAFELDVDTPALGTMEEFVAWHPETDAAIIDQESPLLEAAALYRGLLEFHRDAMNRGGADRSALLAADLDRILWASDAAVGEELTARKEQALRGFIERAGDHETAALATFHLASLLREQGDFVAAREIAAQAAAAHPQSHGGAQCSNLVAQIESKELSLATERAWAAPFPAIRVTYRNLAKVHLRVCKADWLGRLKAGKPHSGWLDDADRSAILALPAVHEHMADLPATPDYQQRSEHIPVGTAFDAAALEPGAYWVIASHKADFGAADNVVALTMVWVTRLAIVTELRQPLVAGHVVDLATGEPVAGATVQLFTVQLFVRQQDRTRRGFAETAQAQTDEKGRFEIKAEQGRELIAVATATVAGLQQIATTESTHVWDHEIDGKVKRIVLVIDRGIHRPGQIVFYKGIVAGGDQTTATYAAVADTGVNVILRDANGREMAKAAHTTSATGSFHGSFPIPAGCLPGQWSIEAQAAGTQGATAVRVEEYKRPKFQVTLAAPKQSVPLGGAASLTGRAETYTGLPVADATVRWRVERVVRFPIWCRWIFPWLPFDGGAQRIARGTTKTDASGSFDVTFPARPDRSVPKESLPVFTYRVEADVTDPGGETRSAERSVNAGYTDVEAAVSAPEWQAVKNGAPAAVPLTVTTTTLDGEPQTAAGRLTVQRLVQPAAVDRGDLQRDRPMLRLRRGAGRLPPQPPEVDPADPQTWAAGETVFEEAVRTDKATGKAIATANLPAGIYRATFEIPAAGDVPAVKATTLVEVVDPTAKNYGIKRPFVMKAEKTSVEPDSEFRALVGTGYDAGRALVEISQSGKVLKRFWTEPGQTQWPVAFAVGAANRGGFTVRAWLVRDGRLHEQSQTVDVPWTDKQLAVEWERFTRRTQPGAQEVWRAKICSLLPLPPGEGRGEGASFAPPINPEQPIEAASPGLRSPHPEGRGKGAPVPAEMLALMYDQSLDALAPHAWPANGLTELFRRESSWLSLAFTNIPQEFHHVRGTFDQRYRDVPEMTFRVLRDPFGTPQGGWGLGRRGGRMFALARGAAPEAMMMADAAPVAAAAAPGVPTAMRKAANGEMAGEGEGGEPGTPPAAQAAPPPRRNLVETAFFLPALTSGTDGVVTIEFTLPDTLTTWQFKGLAHDAALRSGALADTCISAKDLMVEPLVPRFLREGDLVKIPVKVSNTSTGRLAGTVRFSLADARTDRSRDDLIDGPREQAFDLTAGESRPVVFTVTVADGTDVLKYLATGTADASGRKAADGEEAFVPVLPRRVPVTETIPLTIRGPGTRTVSLDRLANSAGTEIRSQSLVVQAASNPAWYAVLALPVIMERSDESTETLFTRLFANTLARHLATSDPRIARVFAQWKGTDSLTSPLEKNTDLMQTLLAETPWVRDAVDETEARARIALLFDTTRATNEARAALERLESLRNGDGGWPWFPGGRTCDSVSLGIIAGCGRLRAAGVATAEPAGTDIIQPALRTIPWLDRRLVEERTWAEKRWQNTPAEIMLTPIGVYALYARSFFTQDAPAEGAAAEAIRWGFDVARKSWMKLDARQSQGQLAIALVRSGDKATALSIIDSLRQRAVDADVKPGAEQESWQGMWWRDRHPGWWSWAHAPIATQAIMIEAFDEVAGDADAVEALKVWLVSQKRTSRWPGSRATADAVGALLGRGGDLLGSQELLTVTVGDETIVPDKAEAGTGFFETRFVRREITPALAAISLTKPDKGVAFGGVHWQYLDDIANVPAAGREELAIEKQLFVKRFTKAGPELVPIAAAGQPAAAEKGGDVAVEVGDELVVRLVVTSDRDYEFLELADQRPCLTEPVDVLSGWRYGDGAGWYVAIRDASTQLFFERLPRGTHVFEYSLRAAHRGMASSGFATIQSRYAPEFSARSASVSLEVH